ncbi:MAG: hypothetical protein D3919_12085 [Candidatus Electrothrix sp. AW5]|nr:hypothetical protein [Candidatus Electrothrix gigas]
MGKRIAIVIGMSEFNDHNFNELKGPAQDAIRLTNVLQDPAIGNYEVKMFVNSSSHSVNKTIEKIFSEVGKNDTVIFYYSGHAKLGSSGRLYLATTDTDMKFLRSTAIPATFVNEVMNESYSKNQIVFLDCCYSGAFAKNLLGGRGRIIISSSSAFQVSIEEKAEGDNFTTGVFTNALIQGLESGEADMNSDGKITCFELFNYIIFKLEDKYQQTPKMYAFDLSTDIAIAESRRRDFKLKSQN